MSTGVVPCAVGRDWTRLDVVKHAITKFVEAKVWCCWWYWLCC